MSAAFYNGSVIINRGNLTITDSCGGGIITGGKTLDFGGGISNYSYATLTINGGKICGNSADYHGGGVFNNSYGTLYVTGGEISGNYAAIQGGGICSNDRSVVLTGGIICGNSTSGNGGGIWSDYGPYISGAVEITGNYKNGTIDGGTGLYVKGDSGTDNNVYWDRAGYYIKISDNNEATASDIFSGTIGVSANTAPTVGVPTTLTRGWSSGCTGIIISDNANYVVDTNSNGQKTLKLTYTVSYDKGANGMGDNTTETKIDGDALTLSDILFIRTGYTQTGWATTDEATTEEYALSASYTANAAVTLYPVWTEKAAISITETTQAAVVYNGSGVAFALTGTNSGLSDFIVEYRVDNVICPHKIEPV